MHRRRVRIGEWNQAGFHPQPDNRAYAEAALADFQSFGERAATDIQKAEHLIAEIEKDAAEKRGGA